MDSSKGLAQKFHGAVGQVAGGNIYNYYDNRVTPAVNTELRRAIRELLAICDPGGQRKLIEKICLQSFNTTNFKSLDVAQVRALTEIAKDIADATKGDCPVVELNKVPWWRFWR